MPTDASNSIDSRLAADASSHYEDHLRAVAEHIPGVIYSYDLKPDGTRSMVYLGPGLDDLVGPQAVEEVKANFNSLFDRIHPSDREAIAQAVAKGMRDGTRVDCEIRLMHDDGEYRWFRSLSKSVRRENGIVRWYIILIDIGEKKDIEERNRLLVDLAPSGIYFGSDGKIEFANRAFASMIGCANPEDLKGRTVLDFVHPDFHDRIRQRIREFDEGERKPKLTEEVYLRVDGTPIPVEAIGTRFTIAGKRCGMVIVRDIRERKRAEETQRRNEEQFRQLAASRQLLLRELNHRVKNHLAAMLSLISMMEREHREGPAVFEALRNRLFGMVTVHEMIAAGGWESVELSSLVQQLMSLFRTADDRDVAYEEHGPKVFISPSQAGPIAMIVQELLINSRKYGALTAPGGRISIEWHETLVNEAGAENVRRLELTWREIGGPPPNQNVEPGIGMRLIKGFSLFELNGDSTFTFAPEGLVCGITARLSSDREGGESTSKGGMVRDLSGIESLADFF